MIWLISIYNGMVVLRNRVRNAFSQIDILSKQRFDMIPNLVEIVKGYASHETETLNRVIEVRNQYNQSSSISEKVEASTMFSQTVGKLFALSEDYPELKANGNFLELQKQLDEMEDQIRFSRQFFNDTVQKYNDKRLVFPTNLIANMFGFQEESYFQIQDQEKENVKISF